MRPKGMVVVGVPGGPPGLAIASCVALKAGLLLL